MTRDSRTVAAIKGQMSKYSGIISMNLSKAKQSLVREMLYGIQAGKDTKLYCITRALNESTPLLKTSYEENALEKIHLTSRFTVSANALGEDLVILHFYQ